jgi:hypothetical protein
MSRRLMTCLAALAIGALAACTEKPQTASHKADAPPSSGAVASFTAPGWKAGDAASWEKQISTRAQGQNDYARINGQ